ncbi:LysM domain-containing protein [Colletotrichum sidae]|uniref:LysM domain-containing protein n=1 Tax=Colletotrichum sidae TaxID=1347389 RepID=A0A4R8TLJ4_9PEZI|nr:LysM domain-containing protein [Colletotrichum sidae]
MPCYVLSSLLLAGSFVDVALAGVAHVRRDGSSLSLTYDPNTTSYCTWWVDLTSAKACSTLLSDNAIDMVSFRRWNRSITDTCVLQTGRSYCVVRQLQRHHTGPVPRLESVRRQHLRRTLGRRVRLRGHHRRRLGLGHGYNQQPPTTGNGIATPTLTQPDMVGNCDSFYLVVSGDTCDAIVSRSRISLSQFIAWNPSVGSSCTGLWLDIHVCISIVGHTPTPTSPGTGVATPSPIQDGTTKSCKTSHFVVWGNNCTTIAQQYGITDA